MSEAENHARTSEPFAHDRYLLKQKRLSLTEKYVLCDEQDRQVLFVRREGHYLRQILAFFGALGAGIVVGAAFILPAILAGNKPYGSVLGVCGLVLGIATMIVMVVWLQPKRHIGFFTDQSMQNEVMTVMQDQKWVFFNATYTAMDAEYNLLGWFRKNHLYNFFRKRWYAYDAKGELICVAMEDSIARSILRRVMGEYGAIIITNFIFVGPDFETQIGEFNRKFTLFDKYVLDLSADPNRTLDRRLAVALGVLLDTGEKR